MHRMRFPAPVHRGRHTRPRTLAWALACLGLVPAAGAAQELTVFTGVEPVRYLAQAVGGDRVSTPVLVPPGQSPHTFEPSPRQLAALERADLYLAAGMPFEDAWVPRLRDALPQLKVVHLLPEADHGHDHAHEGADPHPWTDPMAAIGLADRIRAALIEADPAGSGAYRAGFEALSRDLQRADEVMAGVLAPVRGGTVVVYHPAWGALAARYGLRQLAVESAGKSPGARHLVEVITKARRDNACAVFVQPQFSTRAAEQVARALGAPVVSLDPLAGDLDRHLPATARTLARYLEQPCRR